MLVGSGAQQHRGEGKHRTWRNHPRRVCGGYRSEDCLLCRMSWMAMLNRMTLSGPVRQDTLFLRGTIKLLWLTSPHLNPLPVCSPRDIPDHSPDRAPEDGDDATFEVLEYFKENYDEFVRVHVPSSDSERVVCVMLHRERVMC